MASLINTPLGYLGRHQLQSILWPATALARVWHCLLLVLALLNGFSLGYVVSTAAAERGFNNQTLLTGLNAAFCCVIFIKDFFPSYRNVLTPLSNFYPLTRLHKLGQLLVVDLLSLGNVFFLVLIVAFYATVRNFAFAIDCACEMGLCTVSSFIIRFIIARPKTKTSIAHMALLLCAVGSLVLQAKYYTALTGQAVEYGLGLLIVLVAGIFAYESDVLHPRYSTSSAKASILQRFPKNATTQLLSVYFPKAGSALGLAFGVKALLLAANIAQLHKNGHYVFNSDLLFYAVISPLVSFNYVNNNALGHMSSLTVNAVSRVGLTTRQANDYATALLPALLFDASISLVVIFMMPNTKAMELMPRYFISLLACATIGYAGSILAAQKVDKSVSFSNFKSNTSLPVNLLTCAVCVGLIKLPWIGVVGLLGLTLAAIGGLIWITLSPVGAFSRRLWMKLL